MEVKFNVGLNVFCNMTYLCQYFTMLAFIISKESFESLLFLIKSKRYSNVIKYLDITWILCARLHVCL